MPVKEKEPDCSNSETSEEHIPGPLVLEPQVLTEDLTSYLKEEHSYCKSKSAKYSRNKRNSAFDIPRSKQCDDIPSCNGNAQRYDTTESSVRGDIQEINLHKQCSHLQEEHSYSKSHTNVKYTVSEQENETCSRLLKSLETVPSCEINGPGTESTQVPDDDEGNESNSHTHQPSQSMVSILPKGSTLGYFQCIMCNKKFIEYSYLQRHIELKHRGVRENVNGNVAESAIPMDSVDSPSGSRNKIKCSLCERYFNNTTDYTHHLNIHLKVPGLSVDNLVGNHVADQVEANDLSLSRGIPISTKPSTSVRVIENSDNPNDSGENYCDYTGDPIGMNMTLHHQREMTSPTQRDSDCGIGDIQNINNHRGEGSGEFIFSDINDIKQEEVTCGDEINQINQCPDTHECPGCLKVCDSENDLDLHKGGCNEYKLGVCGMMAPNKQNSSSVLEFDEIEPEEFREEVEEIRTQLYSRCPWCSKELFSKSAFEKHKAKCSKLSVSERIKDSNNLTLNDLNLNFQLELENEMVIEITSPEDGKDVGLSHKLDPLKCTLCDQVFFNCKNLIAHIKTHRKEKAYSCSICNKKFYTKNSIGIHIDMVHYKLKRHPCTLCKRSFYNACQLREHVKGFHYRNRNLSCTLCDKKFVLRQHVNRHMLRVHKKKYRPRIKCHLCDKLFSSKQHLTTHINSFHHNLKPFPCTLCNKPFASKSNLRQHMQGFHRQAERVPCMLCDKTLGSKQNLRLHMAVYHSGAAKPFPCTLCDKSFKVKYYLNQHINAVHKKLFSLQCSTCEKYFTNQTQLREHNNQVHRKIKRFLCSLCGMGFYAKTHFNRHLMTHTGQRPFTCVLCKNGFYKKSALNRHIDGVHRSVSNSVLKPFLCSVCGISYTSESTLREHMDNHAGNKPSTVKKKFNCTVCDKDLPSKRSLRTHINAVHLRKCVCAKCNKAFENKRALARHMSHHMKDRKFSCSVCEKKFYHPQHLKRHLYIFPSFPSFLPCVSTPPATADGPTDLNFGMVMGFGCGLLIFEKSGSKVKGQGQKSIKICLFRADFGHRGYVWDYSGPGRVRWGTFGNMPTNFGNLPNVRERWEASSR